MDRVTVYYHQVVWITRELSKQHDASLLFAPRYTFRGTVTSPMTLQMIMSHSSVASERW